MNNEREFPSLDIRKKAAQLVFPRLDLAKYDIDRDFYISLVKRGVGGFCVFNASTEAMRRAARELNSFADIPLLFSCDMEFGTAMRFSDGTAFPRAGSLGRSGNPGYAYIASNITALEAKSCGIFWNYAPVADVASNPDNPIIGLRAFSDNPSEVVKYKRNMCFPAQSIFPGMAIQASILIWNCRLSKNRLLNCRSANFCRFISRLNSISTASWLDIWLFRLWIRRILLRHYHEKL